MTKNMLRKKATSYFSERATPTALKQMKQQNISLYPICVRVMNLKKCCLKGAFFIQSTKIDMQMHLNVHQAYIFHRGCATSPCCAQWYRNCCATQCVRAVPKLLLLQTIRLQRQNITQKNFPTTLLPQMILHLLRDALSRT